MRYFIFLIFILFNISAHSQAQEQKDIGFTLSMITEFEKGVTNPLKSEISLAKNPKNVKWFLKNNFCCSEDIEYISFFGYNEVHKISEKDKIYRILNSSTGSATTTSLVRIKTSSNSRLAIEIIAGGDRCELGLNLDSIKIRGNVIYFNQFITLDHLKEYDYKNKLFNGYATCMLCCIGKANYAYNLITSEKLLESISIPIKIIKNKTELNTLKHNKKLVFKGEIIMVPENEIKNILNAVNFKGD